LQPMESSKQMINAIDLFCGAGGLSYGLQQAGVNVVAGVDIDSDCEYVYSRNIKAPFLLKDIREISVEDINSLYPKNGYRLLAGCAPCQPFSKHRRGEDTTEDEKWTLLDEFGRIVVGVMPDFVTMENVPGIVSTVVFKRFAQQLIKLGYHVSYKICFCPEYGLPQNRRRLVLLASKLGEVHVPEGTFKPGTYKTVRKIIEDIPPIKSGKESAEDPLHKSLGLSDINLSRIKASKPGGTWRDWPVDLLADCHRRKSGSSFQSVYGRMHWDEPSPTITTQFYNFGTGRYGHPAQHRALSLREGAMLQGFPKKYVFIEPGKKVYFNSIGRLIGNAVPPPLGKAIGNEITRHILKNRI